MNTLNRQKAKSKFKFEINFKIETTGNTLPTVTALGATPGRARSNDLAEELPPWLTIISRNFINIAHKQINLCVTKCKSRFIFYTRSLLFVRPQTVHTKYIYLLILV